MVGRVTGTLAALAFSVSASAQQAPDIVADAAAAIIGQDEETLASMRFRAFDFNLKPVSVKALVAEIQGCTFIAQYERGVVSLAHEIHYDCPDKPKPKTRCTGETVIVFLQRATSPDVSASLRYSRVETPECALPIAPG